jgi:GTPase SAR1 family protein
MAVYDTTSKKSFEKVRFHLEEACKNCDKDVVFMLLGNKMDLQEQRKVKKLEGNNLAKELGILFSEASAKIGSQIDEAFTKMAESILKKNCFQIGQPDKLSKTQRQSTLQEIAKEQIDYQNCPKKHPRFKGNKDQIEELQMCNLCWLD